MLERRRWTWRGHLFGLYFALAMPLGLLAVGPSGTDLKLWGVFCLGIAIFCWYKAERV